MRQSAGWIRRLLPYLRARPRNWVVALLAGGAAGLAGTLLPLLQRQLLDRAVRGQLASLRVPLALLVLLALLICLAQRTAAYRELTAGNDSQYLLYLAVHERMLQADSSGAEVSAGQVAARLNADIGTLSRALATVPKLLGSVLTGGLTVALMLMLNPLLSLVSLPVLALTAVAVLRARRRVRPATWQAQECEAEVAQQVNNAVAGVRVVKAFAGEWREVDRLAGISSRLYSARMRLTRLLALYQPIGDALPLLAQLGLVLLGGWLVLRHQASLGTFLAFGAYHGQLSASIGWLTGATLDIQEAGVCAGRVLDLLDLPPAVVESPDARPLSRPPGGIVFDNVHFGFSAHAPSVLDGFTLTVAPGETVALVGPAGSGKSTALELLARLHDPARGSVRLDGVDVRDTPLRWLRAQVGLVFQEPFLFSGTLRDNLRYGRPDATQEEIEEATRTAGADEFIAALPDGYDTVVGERAVNLSGGQRQRVALARALLMRPAMLVLDDATSSVDAKLEREIYQRLRHAACGRTTLFVGYRPATLALADRIVVVEAGRVVDEGRHEELLRRCATYRRLVHPPTTRPAPHSAPVLDFAPAPRSGLAPPAAPEPPAAPALPVPANGPARISAWRLVARHRVAFAATVALLAAQAALGVLGPYLTREAVDRGILAGSPGGLFMAAAAIGTAGLAGLLLRMATTMLSGRIGQRLVHWLRVRVWTHLVRLPVAFYERHRTGGLLTRMVNDVESFSTLVSDGLANVFVSLLTLLGVLVAMVAVSPVLAAVTVAAVLPFVFTLWRFNRRMTAAYGRAREKVADANAALQENLAGIREAQAFGQQRRQHAEYARLTRRYLDSRLSAEKLVAGVFPVITFLNGVSLALVLGVGARLLATGALSAGELVAFVLWGAIFFAPVLQLSVFYADWKRTRAATHQLNELLAQPLEEPARGRAAPVGRVRGELRLCGVGFRYPDGREDALRGVDLTVAAGETVAIVGPTGAGKSTIIKLLARFYQPDQGRVLLDGVDTASLDLAGYRRRLGYVPQEPYLFAGSVRDNIAYGRPGATDREVVAAARAVGADEAILALPHGYQQPVGDRGRALSAGQRQLVCLARAYLVDPAVVLLDEATANLDLAAEARVLAAMRAVARGRTSVLIAHRPAVALAADRVAIVENGRIVAVDTPRALLDAGRLDAGSLAAQPALLSTVDVR